MHMRELAGLNIERLRIGLGLSQEALADKAKIDRTYVWRIERGRINVTVNVLQRLVTALKAKPAALFEPIRPGQKRPAPLKKGPKGSRR